MALFQMKRFQELCFAHVYEMIMAGALVLPRQLLSRVHPNQSLLTQEFLEPIPLLNTLSFVDSGHINQSCFSQFFSFCGSALQPPLEVLVRFCSLWGPSGQNNGSPCCIYLLYCFFQLSLGTCLPLDRTLRTVA